MAPGYPSNSSHQVSRSFSTEFFSFTHKLERENSLVNAVRKRLCYVIYYRCKLLWQNNGRSKDLVYVLSRLVEQSGLCELQQAEKSLRGWAERGERYDLLAKDLGGLGALFLLPADKESL
jgi:hypothetical protein